MREEGVVLDAAAELLRRCGLLVGIEQDGELPVGFEHGVFNRGENALIAQLLRQLVEREAVVAHRVLLHLTV